MIDANLNRAREALRVIEDFARFALDDRAAAAAAKRMRHDLRGLVQAVGAAALLDARDVAGDVGRETKTVGELRRADLAEICGAAFGRLTEALRVVGECGKLRENAANAGAAPPVPCATDAAADPNPTPEGTAPSGDCDALAGGAEGLRYQAYELEQTLLGRGAARARFRSCRLYVIVTAGLCLSDWLETTAAAIRGGATCVQLREKSFPDGELLARARQLRELTARTNTLLIINDRADIARLCGADGVHVGQDDLSVRDVRRIGGGRLLVGKSTHTREQIDAVLVESPDYIAVGPIFQSTTKPQSHIAGPETLRWASERTQTPLVAIGGITSKNAAQIRESGACICVCSAVIAADDTESATRTLAAAQ